MKSAAACDGVVVDDVPKLIDYAVALDAHSKIRNLEVLAYRESHGYEIRLPAWRRQFVGKSARDRLRVGDDIANVSGATLSCTHLTDGVRRIVRDAKATDYRFSSIILGIVRSVPFQMKEVS